MMTQSLSKIVVLSLMGLSLSSSCYAGPPAAEGDDAPLLLEWNPEKHEENLAKLAREKAEKRFLENYKASLPGSGLHARENEFVRQTRQKALEKRNWNSNGRNLTHDLLSQMGEFLELRDLLVMNNTCKRWGGALQRNPDLRGKIDVLKAWPGYLKFDKLFVPILAGFLPPVAGVAQPVAAFEASKYPVTQKLWQEIMGSLPARVQPNCPDCPVTHVAFENADGSPAEVQTFLARLNAKVAPLGCTYDLPTDLQLHYLMRADTTGTNADLYGTGITSANVDQYVTHYGNSNPDGRGNRIQPVGKKLLNAFGIELGNVWLMSKDLYVPTHPNWGRSIRGGSWALRVSRAESGECDSAYVGERYGDVGFSLLRQCGQ